MQKKGESTKMGSFSWIKADNLGKIANIACGKPFKMLIPKEFGGGFIKDVYQDYGYLGYKEDGSPKYDMYELLAFWNASVHKPFGEKGETVGQFLKYDGDTPPLLKEIDEYTAENRGLGIEIGTSDKRMAFLPFPLKLVSASYKGSYEDCCEFSRNDPWQGTPLTRARYEKILASGLPF